MRKLRNLKPAAGDQIDRSISQSYDKETHHTVFAAQTGALLPLHERSPDRAGKADVSCQFKSRAGHSFRKQRRTSVLTVAHIPAG